MKFMACINKIVIFLPSHQSCRSISLSAWCFRRKPTPVRDPKYRNFQGEKLAEYMRKYADKVAALQPYKDAVAGVIERYRIEVEEEERKKFDVQGETMRREYQEREQALKNLTFIAKNNEEMKKLREIQQTVDKIEAERLKNEELESLRLKDEERKSINTALVHRVSMESQEFITLDNLDERIDSVLDNVVNFNYCINAVGDKIYSTKPPGNLDGWKGPSPSAYKSGGVDFPAEMNTGFWRLKKGGILPQLPPLEKTDRSPDTKT